MDDFMEEKLQAASTSLHGVGIRRWKDLQRPGRGHAIYGAKIHLEHGFVHTAWTI